MFRNIAGPGLIAILALLALRMGIGMHFFSEGLSKIRSGRFDATGFLESACGPMAGTIQTVLSNPDGSRLLCVSPTGDPGSETPAFEMDPELTISVWGDFVDRCSGHYRFGDSTLEKSLAGQRAELAAEIHAARQQEDRKLDTGVLESRRAELEQDILALRAQPKSADLLLDAHLDELRDWLDANRIELIAHYSTADRARQFLRDGQTGPQIAQDVESIRKQVEETRLKRKKKVAEWSGEINSIWDSLEVSINELAVNSQRKASPVVLHRPHDQPGSAIRWINRIVPWFDLIVGILLVLGLFPRLAALAGGLFLASVIATQPPWIPGATPTGYQAVEMMALFVFASGIATIVPGMGWLIPGLKRRPNPTGSIAEPVTAGSQTT